MRVTPLIAYGCLVGLLGCEGASDSVEPVVPPAPTATATSTSMPDPPPPAGGASGGPVTCEAPAPSLAPAALLTRAQYDNTVADLLGDTTTRPSSAFPPENQVDGFNNNIAAHQTNPLLVEKYLEAAEKLAAAAVGGALERVAPCSAGSDQRQCGRAFVRTFGQRAFRRPLTSVELQIFDGLFDRSFDASGYAFGVELVLTAMLQSPQFLYRVDTLPVAPTVETGAVALGPHELASRLSYFLLGSMPDPELFDAAARKQLATDAEITAQARRMLALPRAKEMVREFHHQWFQLDTLPGLTRVAGDVSSDALALGPDFLGSLDRFVDHVYWDVGNVSALLTSKTVFVSPRLAPLYGAAVPATDFAAVELGDRSGIMTQPALLALLAHPEQSAPVLRGVFVRKRLLCLDVPSPPPNANTTPPDPDPSATTRERFKQHTASAECSGCHQLFDGLGFGLEAYDQLGRYRTTENGLPLDTSGQVYGTGKPELEGPFNGAAELSARLASSRVVKDCIATTWYRYAVGRSLTESDSCSLEQARTAFERSAGDLRELLVAITLSDGFRYRAPVAEGSP
jgi:hypothetical protein